MSAVTVNTRISRREWVCVDASTSAPASTRSSPLTSASVLLLPLLFLLNGATRLEAFITPTPLTTIIIPRPRRPAPLFIASSSNDNLDRFHVDLRKVLSPRQDCSEYFVDHLERHVKPIVLPHDVDGAEKSYKMLQHMIRIGCWSEESFQLVMRAFLQRGRVRWKSPTESTTCAADQLEHLWMQLQQLATDEVADGTLHLVLEAYAVCATPRGERNYAMRAQDLLPNLHQRTPEALSHLVHAWAWQQANKDTGECAQRAQSFLEELESMTKDPELLIPAYNYVLEAWSKSLDAPEKANAMFEKRKKLGGVTMGCYTNVILAWSKARDGAQRANDLLNDMLELYHKGKFPPGEEPELIAFNSVMTAWGKAQQPATAERIMHLMEDTRLKCTTLVPNVLTYNAVLHAYFQSARSDVALARALEIVKYMEDNADDQPEIRPDNYTYNTLMKAWIKSGRPEAVENAEQILLKMEHLASLGDETVPLSNRNFNVVINAYAKSTNRLAAQKAHALLDRLRTSNRVQPDVVSYTSVMECYSKSTEPNASDVAMELLQELQTKYETGRDPSLMPNLRTFTMAILSLARCPKLGNAQKARGLLTQLNNLYNTTQNELLKPSAYPYNYVLNCAANTVGTNDDKIAAFQIAAKTYQEMRATGFIKADSYTYAFWLKACNNLLPASTDLYQKFVVLAFEECQKDGLVNQEVLTRLQQGKLSKEVLCKVLKVKPPYQANVVVEDVPPSWSRNAMRRGPPKRMNTNK